MKQFVTSIQIAASREQVWSALIEGLQTDPIAFGIVRLEGKLAPNGRIKLWSEIDPKRSFSLEVKTFDAPHSMVWKGGMPLGLFVGTRTFELSGSDEETMFDMKETFRGPLSGLIARSLPDLEPSFVKFARALKEKAENHE